MSLVEIDSETNSNIIVDTRVWYWSMYGFLNLTRWIVWIENWFKKGRGIDPRPFLCSFTYYFGYLCGLQISAVIALMTGHAWAHNTTADLTRRPDQTTTVIASWGRIGLRQTLWAFNKTLFIYQGLTPGNIDIHPQYSFNRKLHSTRSIAFDWTLMDSSDDFNNKKI